jgi:hypothetical protein
MVRLAIILGSLLLLALGIYLAVRKALECPRCERTDPHDGG